MRLPKAKSTLAPLLLWGGLTTGLPAVAQNPQSTMRDIENRREAQMQMEDAKRRSQNVKRPPGKATPAASAEPVYASEGQLTGRERKILEPDAALRQRFADFLRQPDTGLFKLLSVGVTQTLNVAQPSLPDRLPLLGGGAYYSFTKRKHDQNEWADLRLRDGKLQTAFNAQCLGLLTQLGDVPLEHVQLSSPGVAFLAAFNPPTQFVEAARVYGELKTGITDEGFIYKSELPATPDAVYVLRSISYKRSDWLVAFRLVRQDADGSLTILWKQLQRLPPLTLQDAPGRDPRKLISSNR